MKSIKKLVLAAAVSAIATGAIAATQGDLDSTSTGDFDVTYNKGAEVRIWGLEDVSFNGDDNDITVADLTDTFTFCTFSNNTSEVVFDVTSTDGSFNLNQVGGADTLPYYLELADEGGATLDRWGSETGLSSGSQGYSRYVTQQSDNGGASTLCAVGQQTTDLTVTIPQQEGVPADGAYTDTVTITVKPI